jgi:hypothetical protein
MCSGEGTPQRWVRRGSRTGVVIIHYVMGQYVLYKKAVVHLYPSTTSRRRLRGTAYLDLYSKAISSERYRDI